MDPKAAAKSKRSHTVRGRRAHQTPAAAAAHKQKRAAASASAPRSHNLPSNWDRYDSEGEAEDSASAGEWAGEVAPRSKGADYAFLLEQARAQPREARGVSAPWVPSSDSPFDFMQASASMLEAKGEGILSCCAEDNFILEDDLAPDFEVPFLFMDLHALANQLSKLKPSRRLFIEEDLLPEDMVDASEGNQIPIESDTSVESDTKGSSVEKNMEIRKDVRHHEYGSKIHCDNPNTDSDEEKRERTAVTDPGMGHGEGLNLEVGAAEEELDMLLNSLSGTHLSHSKLDESFGYESTLQGMKISEFDEKVSPAISSKSPAPFDDALDKLLSETSLHVQNEGLVTPSLTSQHTFKSSHNFDLTYTKKIDVTTSTDDSVDGLLEDTSAILNEQKQTTSTQGESNSSNARAFPHSGPSNVSDDFDSWFDSL